MTAPLVVVNPPELGAPRGFAHGIVTAAGGRVLFVAGQIGTEGASAGPDDFVAQFDRALARVLVVVGAAGGRADQIARMTVYVTDMNSIACGICWKTTSRIARSTRSSES